MNDHGTFYGQTKPISISKVLSKQQKIAGYAENSFVPVPLHSAKVIVLCELRILFVAGLFFFEEIGPAGSVACTVNLELYESLLIAQSCDCNPSTVCMSG